MNFLIELTVYTISCVYAGSKRETEREGEIEGENNAVDSKLTVRDLSPSFHTSLKTD